jgi:kynurenine formamidase
MALKIRSTMVLLAAALAAAACTPAVKPAGSLWAAYEQWFKTAKYVDLTHVVEPAMPLWTGFAGIRFGRTANPETGRPYEYGSDGFEANSYALSTDQLGTQLDPPAHWDPFYPAIDELPPTFAVRPLVVISIAEQAAAKPGYHLEVADILRWETRHGRIPEGAVVMVRSDWSKTWPVPELAWQWPFPGVSLPALRFLHEQRHILLHGHEPLDTDTTPNLEGEAWLLQHGYTQAEGVANLDKVPETGALVAIGYAKFRGGLGGLARFIAICPPDWRYGVSIGAVQEAPLPRYAEPLRWNGEKGMRMR